MTWDQLEHDLRNLAQLVDVVPDVIVGVVRGGVVPARLLSKYLKIRSMYCLSVTPREQGRSITTDITAPLTGKTVLLVEDMTESGDTLQAAKAYLEAKGAVVKTAALYTMPHTAIAPDYSYKQITERVTFPWE